MRKIILECLLAVVLSAVGTALGLYLRQHANDDKGGFVAIVLGQSVALILFYKLRHRISGTPKMPSLKLD